MRLQPLCHAEGTGHEGGYFCHLSRRAPRQKVIRYLKATQVILVCFQCHVSHSNSNNARIFMGVDS